MRISGLYFHLLTTIDEALDYQWNTTTKVLDMNSAKDGILVLYIYISIYILYNAYIGYFDKIFSDCWENDFASFDNRSHSIIRKEN